MSGAHDDARGHEAVLALDAGTGSGRAALFDRDGRLLASAARPWRATTPPELAPLGREYDPEAVWGAIAGCVREVVAASGARVRAVAATGQRIGCAFVDHDGATMYLGPNGDVRALLAGDLGDLDPEALYASTGRFPPWIFAPARLRWLAAARPAARARLRHVLGLPDWVAYRLGAEPTTDPTLAADLMLLDVARRERVPVGESAIWPRVEAPGTPIGALSSEAAEALGLSVGTPIALAGADTQLALLGAGVATRGTALVAGSSAPLLRVTGAPVRDPKGRLWTDPHAVDGRWLLEANLGEMGTAHAWTLTTLTELERGPDPYGAYDALARTAAIACRGASAHLGPRAMDLRNLNTGRPAALMMPFGETSAGRPPGRAELLRAFVESCAYATRAGRAWLDSASEPASASTDGPLVVAGGMSRSRFFCEVLASTLGQAVIGGHPDASLRGAAMCAAVATGWCADLEEAMARMHSPGRPHEPDAGAADAYEDGFERWMEREAELEGM